MNLFTGTATYYRQFRPGIPEGVTTVLDQITPARPKGPRRLLDVGTGTGLVVEALLARFDDIIAIDSDAEMLAAAESALRPRLPGSSRLLLVESTAENFVPPADWQADLVTICRAFHWLDQGAVLNLLDSQVASDGVVAIFGDNSFWAAGSPWKEAVRDVIKIFLGEERRAGSGTFQHHNRSYSEIMEESPFNRVEEVRVPVQRTWTSESILGHLYSTSFAAPHLFGDRLEEFEKAVRNQLAEFSDNDTFPEDNEFLIRLGRRSQT
ncbi:class I SAM-dependent methyltransferase [Streptomyces yaanensis]|uniref:Class I SAM-dependent methyltransferase n=1 Tax=Streptomyces yaanensis TaxID=1142239 RepID=A0ABV7SLH0_9ACTN|nr:methyltransferase domain-containing protein [Streptomyces sp. CGMCC 4.7035]WNC02082.1 methyltransferase domain-containing protein [Streptomyces sp. CGMCC 4.7035]